MFLFYNPICDPTGPVNWEALLSISSDSSKIVQIWMSEPFYLLMIIMIKTTVIEPTVEGL